MKKSVLVAAALARSARREPRWPQRNPDPRRRSRWPAARDAGKFCAEHIGKPPQMNACLRANKAKLSDACRKVVESHGG